MYWNSKTKREGHSVSASPGRRRIMIIVFTDLDGTLLDAGTYAWSEAKTALKELTRRDIPLVFCTSKTCSEVEFWRRELGNTHPFIVENGAAVFVPRGYFPLAIPGAASRRCYEVMQFGKPRRILIETLESACAETACRIRPFHRMSASEIAAVTGLSVEQAGLAAQREYTEPFEILAPDHHPLLKAIEERRLEWTQGGRFYHITGGSDKGVAVQWLSNLYSKAFGPTITVGLGDAPNDIEFLNAVDIPIVVRSALAPLVQRAAPGSRVTAAWGAAGWNEAVLNFVGCVA
jgi:mannosyl-3-phosphoglycerate phosphatase